MPKSRFRGRLRQPVRGQLKKAERRAMKSILLPVEPNSGIDSAFECADLLARKFGGKVDCIALKPSIVDFIAPDPVVVVLPQTGYSEADAVKAARERFDA